MNKITITEVPAYSPMSAQRNEYMAALHIAENGDSKKTRSEARKWFRGDVSAEMIARAHFASLLMLKKQDFANADEACEHANKWAADASIPARAISATQDAMRRTTSFTVSLA